MEMHIPNTVYIYIYIYIYTVAAPGFFAGGAKGGGLTVQRGC